MAATEIRQSNEQKKVIWAIGLGVVALIALWWTFFGFGGSSTPKTRNQAIVASASPTPATSRFQQTQSASPNVPYEAREIDLNIRVPLVPEPRRNIFGYFEPPPKLSTPTPTPAPTPTPPVLLASISPSNVYARTDDFKLEAMGNMFTTTMRIFVDERELPTAFISPQQVTATVPAALIANQGQRQIVLRDGPLFSNTVMLNVTAPPTPNYTYIGIIGKPRHIGDTAILQDKASKDILNVQRGDLLGGRFKVTSI